MADKDYYSFDEVLSEMRMEEDELKRLVSAGEIRAFRDQDTMKFKAEDVIRLRTDDEVEADLELDLGDDLVLEDEELDLGGDVEEIDLAEEATPRRRGAGRAAAAAPAATKRSARQTVQTEQATEGVAVVFGLILGFIVLFVGVMVSFDTVRGSPSNGLSEAVSNMFKN